MMADMLDFNSAASQGDKPITLALAYAARGWPVFPCNPLNKRPLTEHGFKDATTDPFRIRAWWGQHPLAMIGIPTGAATGFWVFDIDTDRSKGKDGLGSIGAMGHDLSELTDTAVAITASGGYHCLFRYDPDAPIGNARGALKPHLDVRGEGGYIIAAGSRRADGESYSWMNPPDENEIADAPDWLLETIRAAPAGGDPDRGEFDFNEPRRDGREIDDLIRGIVSGETYHDNLISLAARFIGSNMHPGAVVTALRGMMEAVPVPRRDDRWRERYNDIPRTVHTAEVKFAPVAKPAEPDPVEHGKFRFKLTAFEDIPEHHLKDWLIEDLLGAGEYSVIYGAPGCGKSVLMGDAAAHVAAGLPWFGLDVSPCAVLYIAAERAGLVKRRMAAWRKRHGIVALPLEVVEGIFDFCTGPIDPTEIVRIVEWVAAKYGMPVGWIIVDTKAQVMGAGDENSSREIGAFNTNIARFQATGAHVTVVDHTPLHDPLRMRGSGALAGAADGSFLVKKEEGVRILTIGSKAPNDGPDEMEIVFGLESVVLGMNEKGKETKAPVVVSAERTEPAAPQEGVSETASLQQKILRLVTQAHANGQKSGFTSLKATTGANAGSLSKALRKMTDAGHIIEVPIEGGTKLWTLP